MPDRTDKVSSNSSAAGPDGQLYLASGQRMAMRMWRDEQPTSDKPTSSHDYEVLGFVVSGRADLLMGGQTIALEPGDSWCVPAGAEHTYRILEPFTAVETTSPPFLQSK